MPEIRPVEERDASAWAQMRHDLWPDTTLEDMLAETRAFFANTSRYITAAFIDYDNKTPAGFIELNLRPYAEGCQSSPVPHIEAWYVTPAARRSGIGTNLMKTAETWALTHGFNELTSDTTDSYPDSSHAHPAHGFTEGEHLITFHKQLS